MSRPFLAAALAAIAASLPAAATGSPAATLQGVVTAEATISLQNADGTDVRHLDPGSYTINVDDRSVEHNFDLAGPGVNQLTEIDGVGMTTWTVDFVNGTYTFRCDAHPATMRGTFTVGTTPIVPKLTGTVTARGISLKNAAGARVRTLPTNTYKITVNDRTKAQNFHLTGPGVNRKTKIGATTKATWTLELMPGKHTYRSDKNKKLRGTFTVTSVPPA